MNDDRPFLLLRARAAPGHMARFRDWFHHVHLTDASRIPGVVSLRSGATPGGTLLGLYTFASSEVVQASLASPEAAYARGTWEQWAGQLEELTIELMAPLFPLPIYQSRS